MLHISFTCKIYLSSYVVIPEMWFAHGTTRLCYNRHFSLTTYMQYVPYSPICRGYPAKSVLSAMCKHGGYGPFGRIPLMSLKYDLYSTLELSCCLHYHQISGSLFNIKMLSYQCRKSHCRDKTVIRLSYLHNEISYTGKMPSLYGRILKTKSMFDVANMLKNWLSKMCQ